MTVINPFDFFVEPYAETFPFAYAPALAKELIPFLETAPRGPRLAAWLERLPADDPAGREDGATCWCGSTSSCSSEISYLVRMEPGVQTPDATLERRAAARAATRAGCSCRSCATSGSPRASRRAT